MGMLVVFKAHPRTVGVTPIIGALRGGGGVFSIGIYIATRRHSLLSRILRVFRVGPSCSLGVVGSKRSLCSVADQMLLRLESILVRTGPSIMLIRNSAAASVTTSLTTFCTRVPIYRIRTNLHARGVCDP